MNKQQAQQILDTAYAFSDEDTFDSNKDSYPTTVVGDNWIAATRDSVYFVQGDEPTEYSLERVKAIAKE